MPRPRLAALVLRAIASRLRPKLDVARVEQVKDDRGVVVLKVRRASPRAPAPKGPST